ncbi:MAG: MBL fold metallo-hydrolase [Acidimicrobiales bacterium]|nr:MBL fold metallo-hydrolase [Acidimicrobiales bacterium]
MRWKIGDVTVTMVREITTLVDGAGMFPEHYDASIVEAHSSWLRPHFVDDDGMLHLSIHALVVESLGRTIVVDTCIGSRPVPGFAEMSDLQTGFLDRFAEAGFALDAVDVVLCTHLHFDHVGWNTMLVDGAWVPTFPAARYLFARTEYEYWDAGHEGAAVTFSDAVRPVFEAGQADLVDMDHSVTDEVWLEPSPGHSPGHVSVCISSGGERAVITGDLVHHPVQFVAPDWAMAADVDPAMASRTRTGFRGRYTDSGVLVFGTHFGGPSTGHLVTDADSHRFDVVT